jgi:molybdenum cofactor cytidylyltransferase
MGAFKPLLPFGKTTVIESCIDYLRAGGVDTIVVVVGYREDEVRERLAQSSVIFALNPDPSSEMADSIRCGVEKLPDNLAATLIALVDHPAVDPEVVATLISEWMKGAELIIPTWQGRGGHPVIIDLSFRAELESLGPIPGLKSLFDRNREKVRRIEVSSPYIARDMDTWDDYTRLYSDVFGQAPPV